MSRESQRRARIKRKTRETEIELTFHLDGRGKYRLQTGIPFINHLVELFARHGRFDLELDAKGDLEVDYHHIVEDMGITLGQAFTAAIGNKGGIRRFSSCTLPMDEALVRVVVDVSARPYLCYNLNLRNRTILQFDAQLMEEFFRAFVYNAQITLHIDCIRGKNTHHILEAAMKGFGIALHQASEIIYPPEEIPSTKGVL